ncbi:hypothetical protein [Streptomyces sp. NPDC001601]
MPQAQGLAVADPGVQQQGEQQTVPKVFTGIQDLLDLGGSQDAGGASGRS